VLWRARAPLRISFVGGGTDFPQVYAVHGGATLTMAITLYTVATLRASAGSTLLRSIDLGRETLLPDGAMHAAEETASALPLHLAAARAFRLGAGYTLETVSPVPIGSGLGASSALTAAMVAVLARNAGRSLAPRELARLAWFVERKVAGLAGGVQDQWASAIGGVCSMQFDAEGVSAMRLQLPTDTLAELESRFLLLRREGGGTPRPANTGPSDPDPAYIRTMLALAEDMRRALVEGKVQQFCVLLHEAWLAKQALGSAQHPAIAEVYEAALQHGALGGKQLGGPGGGHLLLLADPADQQAVHRAVAHAGWQPVSIAIAPEGVAAWSGRHW